MSCRCRNCPADVTARRAAKGLVPFCEITPSTAPRAPTSWDTREEAVAALGHDRVYFGAAGGSNGHGPRAWRSQRS